MDSRSSQVSLIFLMIISSLVQTLTAQVTPDPVCTSTGHRCITPDQCSSLSLPNGQYQWCGGCQYSVRCLGAVGELFEPFNPPYIQWDDNKKNFELISTTCVECYYPCPPGPSAPTNPSGPRCYQTGLGCLNDTCPGGAIGNFQYCIDCSNYVSCSLQTGYTLASCPTGTFYDDIARTCRTSSTTCRECYATCVPPTTTGPPTTTEPPTTTKPPVAPTTQPGGSDVTTPTDSTTPTDASSTITINSLCLFISILRVLNAIFYK